MSLTQKAARGVVWSSTRIWGWQIISFVVLLILSRLLAPGDFGLVALANTFLVLTQIFLDQGFSQAIVQHPDPSDEHLDTAFWTNIFFGLLLTSILFFASDFISVLFSEPDLSLVVKVMSFTLLVKSLASVQEALLKRKLDFRSLAIRTVSGILIGGTVAIIIAFLGAGVWSLVTQNLLSVSIGTVLLWVMSDWRPRFHFSRKYFRELFDFGINIVGSNLMDFVARRSDDLLIGYFLGTEMLGYYDIAYRLIRTLVSSVAGIMGGVAFPVFSRVSHDREKLTRGFFRAVKLASVVAFPAFIGIMVLSQEIVIALYGAKWSTSIPVMRILTTVGIMQSIFYFNHSIMLAAGKPNWILIIAVFRSLFIFVCFLIAVNWGIVAVALAFVVANYLLAPLELWAISKLIDFHFLRYLRELATSFIGSVLMAIVVFFVNGFQIGLGYGTQIRLALDILLGIFVYFSYIWLASPMLVQGIFGLLPFKKLGRFKIS